MQWQRLGKGGLPSSQAPQVALELKWPCNNVVASVESERRLLPILHREGESGRGTDLPEARQEEIKALATECGFTLFQALSLRRTKLRSLPDGKQRFWERPGLRQAMGTGASQQECAGLFEMAIETFLKEAGAKFKTQKMLLAEGRKKKKSGRALATPDLFFPKPIRVEGRLVHWIDAKNFYGSAHFADNAQLPIGKVRADAAKYVHAYGPGALVFAQVACTPTLLKRS